MTRWQLEGNAAEAYERYLVPAFFGPFADRLIELAEPRAADRMLDVACGTGIVARRVASCVARVVGLDLNPAMLEVAWAADPAIEWLAGDAGAMPVPDRSFDLVLCQQGLQFLPDRAAGLRELRRVLAPGGRLAVSPLEGGRAQPGLAPAHGGARAPGRPGRRLDHAPPRSPSASRISATCSATVFPRRRGPDPDRGRAVSIGAGPPAPARRLASPLAGPLSALARLRRARPSSVTSPTPCGRTPMTTASAFRWRRTSSRRSARTGTIPAMADEDLRASDAEREQLVARCASMPRTGG